MGARADAKLRSRAAVIEAARKLFHKHGYDAVGIRDVAEALGHSTGMIFAHFSGKAALFEAAMGHPAPDVQAFLAELVTLLRDKDGPAPVTCEALANRADRLRRHLVGNHA